MLFFVAIAGAVAAGCLIARLVEFTMRWIKSRINQLLANRRAKKVAVMEVSTLIDGCSNRVSLDQFNNMDYAVVTIDDDGDVLGDVEFYEDTSFGDVEVERMMGREGMVVIEG